MGAQTRSIGLDVVGTELDSASSLLGSLVDMRISLPDNKSRVLIFGVVTFAPRVMFGG